MPRTVTFDLNDEQAETLDALAAGAGVSPELLLVSALGRGLSVMIADVEYLGPGDEWENPADRAPVSSPAKQANGPDLDDLIPF